jgi:thiamine-monophosphate kinase
VGDAHPTEEDMGKSEFELIEWIRRHGSGVAGRSEVLVGIGDDMAVLEPGAGKILITTDMLLDGVHFDLATTTLEAVGYKTMACSLSDCAAMASEPLAAVVAVALPNKMSMADAESLHAGLQKAGAKYNCPLVGGDTTSWDQPLAITVTMLSRTAGHEPVLRSGAKAGDAIFVTGELGGSLMGRHLEFEPRVAEALRLVEIANIHAMIDISDGLSIDLDHICQESGVSAVIDAAAIPVSAAARKSAAPLSAALHDGEDFELLFCVGAGEADTLQAEWAKKSAVKLTRIGEITTTKQGGRVFLRYGDGRIELCPIKGWQHFK